jgi:ATP-dependent Clp protease ATP-binding subunit ClpC
VSDFAPDIEQVVALGMNEAQRAHTRVLGTPHLFIGLIKLNSLTASDLRAQGHDPKTVRDAIRARMGSGDATSSQEPTLTSRARANLKRASELAAQEGILLAGERHLLTAILSEGEGITIEVLRKLDVDLDALSKAGALSTSTPLLDHLGRDLTRLACEGKLDPVIGRDAEIRRLQRTLVRKSKNNPVLVGPAGVGKTAVVEGLAQAIATGQVTDDLKATRLVELTTAALIADTTYRGQFEERLLKLLAEIKRAGNVILFIDEIHTILRTGAVEGGALDAGNILKPALARGEVRCIGATTEDEYKQYVASDAALERRFQPIWVGEPSPEATLAILRGVKARYAEHHHVIIADDALEAAVRLSVAWLPGRRLPDKALDLLDEACSRARVPSVAMPGDASLVVTSQTVAKVLSEWVNVSVEELLSL